MIPNNYNTATVEGSLDAAESIAMTIDASATAHIMSVLTNLYSDQELACLREYSTNALDSHIEAGQTRPIEVTLPTPLSSYLKIRDFGVGMNMDDLRDTYSKYGASTKRNSNDFNGTLGLGSKSALTYTHQFTVISVKDGVKYHIAVSRVEDGSATMQVVDTVSTNEPNGVEISIPVKPMNSFEAKARNFFQFWKPGTILLNGEEPQVDLVKISDRIYTFGEGSREGNYIVMANVPYPVKHSLDGGIHGYNRRFGIVAFVETGDIHFTPSREELMYTPLTNAVISSIQGEYKAHITRTIKDEIDAAKTASDAYQICKRWREKVGDQFITNNKLNMWQGKTVPSGYITTTINGYTNNLLGMTWSMNRSRYAVDSRTALTYDRLADGLIITGYGAKNTVPYAHKEKIRVYLGQIGSGTRTVIFLSGDEIPGAPWTENLTSVPWETIAAIRLAPTAPTGGGKSYAGGYDIWDKDGIKVRHDLKPTDNVIYYSNADYKSDRYGTDKIAFREYTLLTSVFPGVRLVQASRNRWDKLKRLFPNSKELTTALIDASKTISTTLTWADQVRLCNSGYSPMKSLRSHHNEFDDPDIKRWLSALAEKESAAQKRYSDFQALALSATGRRFAAEEIPNPFDKYPLADANHVKDTIIYVNAAYAARKDTK